MVQFGPILSVWSPILSVGYGIIMDKKIDVGLNYGPTILEQLQNKRLRYDPQIRIKCKRMTRYRVSKYELLCRTTIMINGKYLVRWGCPCTGNYTLPPDW